MLPLVHNGSQRSGSRLSPAEKSVRPNSDEPSGHQRIVDQSTAFRLSAFVGPWSDI